MTKKRQKLGLQEKYSQTIHVFDVMRVEKKPLMVLEAVSIFVAVTLLNGQKQARNLLDCPAPIGYLGSLDITGLFVL